MNIKYSDGYTKYLHNFHHTEGDISFFCESEAKPLPNLT